MLLPSRSARFLTFLSCFNEKLLRKNLIPIKPVLECVMPTLKHCWLLGFVDGEGCFTVTFLSNSNGFIMTFLITQKWEANKFVLEHILSLLFCNGGVRSRINTDYWDLKINGLNNCSSLLLYFYKYGLTLKTGLGKKT